VVFATTDLSPKAISNYEMGLVFEELIRRFAESSNETAGEHFTPRDIVRLTTSLVFMEDDEALTQDGIIRTIYDPTAGTGGFLSSGMEYVHELNPNAVMRAFGQELNPESYAICKADMLIKGQDVSRIKLGNTSLTTSCRRTSSTTCSLTRRLAWTGRRLRARLTTNIRRKALTVALARACRVFPTARCCS
jgi:type I restriction-modification system DNA methylase subunit